MGAEPPGGHGAILGTGGLGRQATFNLDGHRVTLEFTPNSIRNPFQLPAFSCP